MEEEKRSLSDQAGVWQPCTLAQCHLLRTHFSGVVSVQTAGALGM